LTLQRIIQVTVNDFRIWNGENPWNLVDGLNVLYGPNGSGKTSLWEAIVAGLLDKHTGKHNERRRVKGTSDKPKVKIDFIVDGTEYRIYKEFGGTRPQSQATLSVHEDDGWVELSTGDPALNECRQLIAGAESPDLSGTARGGLDVAITNHLMQLLLPPQGSLVNLGETPAGVASLGVNEELHQTATILGRIHSAIKTDADSIWHANRGELRVRSDAGRFEAECNRLIESIESHQNSLEPVPELVLRLKALEDEVGEFSGTDERFERARTLRKQAADHQKLREEALAAVTTSRVEKERLVLLRAERNRQLSDWEVSVGAHNEAENTASASQRKLAGVRKRAETSEASLSTLRSRVDILRLWIEHEAAESTENEMKIRLADVSGKIKTVDSAQLKLDEKLASKGALNLPSEEQWADWDRIDAEYREAKGRRDAGAWRLEASIPDDYSLDIDGLAITGPEEQPDFASKSIHLEGPEGSGFTFSASAPPADEQEFHRLESDRLEFLATFDSETIDSIRQREVQSQLLDQTIQGLESQISEALSGSTRDVLIGERGRLEASLELLQGRQPPEGDKPDGDLEAWRITRDVLTPDLETANTEHSELLQEFARVDEGNTTAISTRDSCSTSVETLQATLLAHRESHALDDDLNRLTEAAIVDHEELNTTWTDLDDAKDASEVQPQQTAVDLQDELHSSVEGRRRIGHVEGKLDAIRSGNHDDEIRRLNVDLSNKSRQRDSALVNANAIKLLESELDTELERVQGAGGDEVRTLVDRWLQVLMGGEAGDLTLLVDNHGKPTGMRDGDGREFDFDEESFGTREQMSLLYRLAVARLLSEQAGHGCCIMLDDPFGHTDPTRRQNMLHIIRSEIQNCGHQVLVFTCLPEQFEGPGNHIYIREHLE